MKFLLQKPAALIAGLALLQTLSASWLLRIDGFFAANSILFLLCGLGIGFLLLRMETRPQERSKTPWRRILVFAAILATIVACSYMLAGKIIGGTPLAKEYADMLPIMRVMGSRFLDGNWARVYDPVPEIWGGIQPIYLPGLWMPFSAAIFLHFDMRWITVGGIWLATAFITWPLLRAKAIKTIIVGTGLLLLLAWLHFDRVNNVIRLTEEGVPFFYYALLATALVLNRPWLVGIAAALCLLSRYAMIGWIPFALLYLLFSRRFPFLVKALAAAAITVLLLAIIPFGLKPFLVQLQVPAGYIPHATRIWKENPEYFYQSLGMAKFFGPAHIRLLHSILEAGSIVVPLSFLTLARKTSIPSHVALLAGLQVTISFFYSFVDVSYLYLYYTPVIVSLVIAAWALANEY